VLVLLSNHCRRKAAPRVDVGNLITFSLLVLSVTSNLCEVISKCHAHNYLA
jgi:hypothetical protein